MNGPRFTSADVAIVRSAIAGRLGEDAAAAEIFDFGTGIVGAASVLIASPAYPGGVEQFRNAIAFVPGWADAATAKEMIARYESFESHQAFVDHFAESAADVLAGWADRLQANPPSEQDRRALA